MSVAEEIANLGKAMTAGYDARVAFLGKNSVDVNKPGVDVNKLLSRFAKDRKAMGRRLRANLGGFADDLAGTTEGLRAKFHKAQNAAHRDAKEAHTAWMSTLKSIALKRRNFNRDLAKAKQKMSRCH